MEKDTLGGTQQLNVGGLEIFGEEMAQEDRTHPLYVLDGCSGQICSGFLQTPRIQLLFLKREERPNLSTCVHEMMHFGDSFIRCHPFRLWGCDIIKRWLVTFVRMH